MTYTSSQIDALQSSIDAARSALNAGNASDVSKNIVAYYQAQSSERNYATNAVQVVSDTGLFGQVANQELINALGQPRAR